jgi:ATP-dependent helicase HrpB
LLDRVLALEAFERDGRASSHVGELNVGAAQFALRARDQFERMLDGARGRRDEHALSRAVLAAFPDRVAKRREPHGRRGVLANGRGVTLADESAVLKPELFVCVELDAGRRGERAEAFVRIASGVERAWLPRERLRDVVEVAFDDAKERVTAFRRTLLDDLVLDEAQTALPDDGTVARVLAEAASKQLERVLPEDDAAFDGFFVRARCLAEWMPELELPRVDDELRAILPDLCEGRRSFDELRRAPWIDFLKARFTHKQLQALDREAPERLAVPSGSHIVVRYELGQAPVLAVRIQELFGLADTPRIAAGRVNVVMHLLAPNHRPQQITEDLRSFWNNTYPAVSKELKRRYPRHAWPDDPWNAPPERRPKRKPRA